VVTKNEDYLMNNTSGNDKFFSLILLNDKEEIKKYIKNGVDLNCRNINGYQPIEFALMYSDFEIFDLLIKNGAKINIDDNDIPNRVILTAIKKDKINELTLIFNKLKNNINFSIYVKYAINNPEILQMIIDYGADIDYNIKGMNIININTTALIECSTYGSTECLSILISNSSNIDFTDFYGKTALMHACENENLEHIVLLLENGADPNIYTRNYNKYEDYCDCSCDKYDYDEITALDYAIMAKNREIIKLLIHNGAI
jgi:ankyrin repeat protein